MSHSKIHRACALLATAGMLWAAASADAGLFTRAKSRKSPAATSRAQSPAYEPAPAPAAGAWSQPAASPVPWYESWNQSSYAESEFCCGPEDKHAGHRRRSRKIFGQTFYCTVPPYCMPCYGANPTCWRRGWECTVCPREGLAPPPEPRRPTTPKAAATPPAAVPTTPPLPEEGEPPVPQSSLHPNGAAAVSPVSSRREAPKGFDRSRWTSYTDTVADEDQIPEAPAEMLEDEAAEDSEAATEAAAESEGSEYDADLLETTELPVSEEE